MNKLKDHYSFIKDLVNAFPEIKDDVLDEDIITLQIGYLTGFTQQAISNHDLKLINKIFDFVSDQIDLVDDKIKNSLYISYLGKLVIPSGSNVQNLVPMKLRLIINQITEYHSSESKSQKASDFLRKL